MKFDELYEYFSDTLLEKFEGKKKVKEFPSDTSSIGGLPYYGKGGKNLKRKDSSEEDKNNITQQQIEVYKKIFDELSKEQQGFDYNNMVNIAKRIFITQGQNPTTANYNARGFTTAIMNALEDAEDNTSITSAESPNATDKEDRQSKFDSIADDIKSNLDDKQGTIKNGYFTLVKISEDDLREKMKPLFRRENFERTDAYGIINTIRTEPPGYFNLARLISRLEEDGDLEGTLTVSRVTSTLEKLIKDNIITASDIGIDSSEDSGVPALDATDDSQDRVNFKTDDAERIAARTSGDIYRKPRYRDPEHRDREDLPYM